MTTIILVTLGILLTAVAALMTLFYGGPSFANGSVGASADSLQNVGQNVEAAATLYAAQTGTIPTDLTTLEDGSYMVAPATTTGTIQSAWRTFGASGPAFVVTAVPEDVCARIQRNLTGSPAIPTTPSGKFGCIADQADHVYYAMIVGAGGAAAPAAQEGPDRSFVWTPGYSEKYGTMRYGSAGSPVAANGITSTGVPNLARGYQVVSQNGNYQLRMQYDGNLVEYRKDGSVVWTANIAGDNYRLAVQPDGNIVVYDASGTARWSPNTFGKNPQMVLQNDGNLVVYYSDRGPWATNAYDH